MIEVMRAWKDPGPGYDGQAAEAERIRFGRRVEGLTGALAGPRTVCRCIRLAAASVIGSSRFSQHVSVNAFNARPLRCDWSFVQQLSISYRTLHVA